ncbi:MAG: 30S ribosomal protein S2 [Candidatus Methanofastidiosia archaeon]
MNDELLISLDKYLASGIHIGTQQKTRDMERYIYRVRQDGLYILDVKTTDDRISDAGKLLSKYPPEKIMIVSSRQYGFTPIETFAKLTGAVAVAGRFIPGTLTNSRCETFSEPEIIILTDPRADRQALAEATSIGIPVIALCDSENVLKNLDLVIPTNNKGKKALSLIYYLLAREMLRAKGVLKEEDDLGIGTEDFESKLA